MSDLEDPAPKHRSARRPRGPRRLIFLAGAAILLVGLLAAFGGRPLLYALIGPPDYTGAGTGKVVVQVTAGQSAGAIGDTLQRRAVVKSSQAFRDAAASNPRARTVQPGYYSLRAQMSARAALVLLLDPAARLRSKVVLPEGTSLTTALMLIAKGSEIPLAELTAAAAEPATLGLPAYAKNHLEGLLFPATYDVEPGTTARALLTTMVQRFGQAAAQVDLVAGAARIGRSPYDVLIVASLIEKETAYAGDRARVARVVYNRLAIDMALQFDSTVNYSKAEPTARLSNKDTMVESAHNTYLHKGLPPTPIDAPGVLALEAALQPAAGSYIFFVTISKDGRSLFTASYPEFLAAKAKSQREGVY